jgi:hypothetical protein
MGCWAGANLKRPAGTERQAANCAAAASVWHKWEAARELPASKKAKVLRQWNRQDNPISELSYRDLRRFLFDFAV